MNVSIVGTGYVGLVTGAGLAAVGHDVVCIDSDSAKIASLQAGQVPFHEPGLEELMRSAAAAGRLRFTAALDEGCQAATIIMLAVGTPSNGNGEADLSALTDCARRLAEILRHRCLVVIKSTVPPGTAEDLQSLFDGRHPAGRSEIRVASNPEFLAEGSAVEDFLHPARIVIGVEDDQAAELLDALYAPIDPEANRRLILDLRTAEYAKYACNAMLAARVSVVNELANIATACGADVAGVFRVVGSDPRIGQRYLHPGPGFGGSCLPKDVRALRSIAASQGEAAPLLECVENSNDQQRDRLLHTVAAYFGERLRFRKIAVWGLSFKPGTDDTRESPALRLVDRLLEAGATVQACDPAVRRLPGGHRRGFSLQTDPVAACDRAELLCVMTDWPQYQNPNWTEIVSRMDSPAVLDPHRLYNKAAMSAMGLRYLGPDHRSMAWTYSGMNSFDSALHRSSSSSAAP